MKKMNYERPLAEVIELTAEDIITTSIFTDALNGGTGIGLNIDGEVGMTTADGVIKLN